MSYLVAQERAESGRSRKWKHRWNTTRDSLRQGVERLSSFVEKL